MKITTLALALLLLPLALALNVDCNQIPNSDYCNDIQNSNLSEEEKSYLLADIMSNTKHYPDHALVQNWNRNIPTDVKPQNTPQQNRGYIRNAWMKMLTVMPSILLNDNLYINTQGEIITAFNHQVQIPQHTEAGDCRTERSLQSNTGTLRLYVSNQLQGLLLLSIYL